MATLCRLTARAQMHDALREPGYEFTLADGELGPHKTVVRAHETINVGADNKRNLGQYEDVPLYEVFIDGVWSMPQKCRLLARAEIAGAVRDPGFVFELADGQAGPSRTVVASSDGANHDGRSMPTREEKLYEVLDEAKPSPP